LNADEEQPSGSTVDVFLAPVPSYGWVRYSEKDIWAYTAPLAPGAEDELVITHFGSTQEPILFSQQEIGEIQKFYVRIDSHHLYPYGLVPEGDEMNNVAGPVDLWSRRMYLPLALR
jgi:hypothetical protein